MVLGTSRRRAARGHEEVIPDELIANIPVFDGDSATENDEDANLPILVPIDADEGDHAAPEAEPATEDEDAMTEAGQTEEATNVEGLAAQLRYDMGEAFARELDRAATTITTALGDLEARLLTAEAELADAREAVETERRAREVAERRLAAFKELALK